MPSRISIGDWRLPLPHLPQSTLILLQLAGPLSPSYDQCVPRATGGGGGGAAFTTAARLARAAARAAWVARISARRAAMRSDRSTSAASSFSRAVGATTTGALASLPFTDSVRVFMAAARADADMGADAVALAGAGASLALAMAVITARLQANRALKCRMEIQKVRIPSGLRL
ncbi:hypothetical protein D3C72_1657180 [compost metagenome]